MPKPTPPFPPFPKWTQAKFFSFIRSALRSASQRWPPKQESKKLSRRPYTGDNPRMKWEYQCSLCEKWFSDKETEVDHIVPVGSLNDYFDLPGFVERMFCGVDGFRVVCKQCHAIETKKQHASLRALYPQEISIYYSMLSRCYNEKAVGFDHYGGRGISVCDRWRKSFYNFKEDMGDRPDGLTLDRINVNGNYEPNNCRWATYEEQANNKTDNVFLQVNDDVRTISQWARFLGLKPNTICYRLIRGWSIKEALGFSKRVVPSRRKIRGETLDYVIKEVLSGRTCTDVAKEIGIDNSAVSRVMCDYRRSLIKNNKIT